MCFIHVCWLNRQTFKIENKLIFMDRKTKQTEHEIPSRDILL